ncbi:MAG: ROK family transcriptional regulator [Pseudomonadota bacterium]|nr:ROK family transcriptional regulator [Pseudomonadota bacterium]
MVTTGDQSVLKRMNSVALIRLLKSETGLSRADLAKRSGLTKSTIGLLVQELIDDGWLREADITASGSLGRRPTPLQLDPTRLALLGAEIGVDYLNVVACNLQGQLIDSRMQRFEHRQRDATLEALAAMIAGLHRQLQRDGRRSLGIGIGIPGTIDVHGQRICALPNLAWDDLDLRQPLLAALARRKVRALPLVILNEANAGALSEYVFGASQHTEPLVYLSIGIGLGGGIVLDDQLYRGHDGAAGEFGHTILQLDGPLCSCGRHGCAEAFISQRAVSFGVDGPDRPILTIDELASRLRARDPAVVGAVERAGRYLGMLMQNVCNSIDPAVIVLGGPLCQLGEPLIATARASLAALAGRFDAHTTVVRECQFGLNAGAMGAAGAVLHAALRDKVALAD